ncbi:MAG: hypothetical protein RQ760_08160 [Sedimentisphaerales bacterium]|nr:hypothetical protein [Sedimentisphaerales bacterium]
MKSFIRAITIIIILTLIPTVSATAQITPASAPAPAPVPTPAPAPVPAPAPIAPVLGSNDAFVQLKTLLGRTNQQPGGGKVLVIPTEQIKPQDMVTLMEDMTVMCRIFNQKLVQSNLIPGMPFVGRMMRFPSPFSPDSQSMRAMYIQGYGTLFMTTVDFPLSPPPQAEEQEKTEAEETDPLWEQMKQEIFLPHGDIMRAPVQPEEKYDPKKVENLKTTLIKSLVHAANIRGLKPDESVILTVTGQASRSSTVVVSDPRTNSYIVSNKNNKTVRIYTGGLPNELADSSTVLVIRAKKSYIDALAQNKIDYEEFEEKIQLISYPRLGAATSHSPYGSFSAGSNVGARSSGVNTIVPSSGR